MYKKVILSLTCACLLAAVPALAQGINTVTVKEQPVTLHYTAYAAAGPIAILRVTAGAAGTVEEVNVVPGDHVAAGETLAVLGGAQMKAALAQDTAAVKTAEARTSAAKRLLSIALKTLSDRLGTRQTYERAKSDLVAATAAETAAKAKLQALQKMASVKAPVGGVVLALHASNGTRVAAGAGLLTLRPDNSIWLAATYYGADAEKIHVGMKGVFTPSFHRVPVPVVVRSVFAASSAHGGVTVGMIPAEKGKTLRDGLFGNVALGRVVKKMVAVPTRALVLDHGQWWVLVKNAQGLEKKKVTPGPAHGWQTFIRNGVKAGAAVVTDNAYALFHRGIAGRYQPPD